MNQPSQHMLKALRRAVKAQRALIDAIGDLAGEVSSTGLNEAQQEDLESTVENLAFRQAEDLMGDPPKPGMRDLKDLLHSLRFLQP